MTLLHPWWLLAVAFFLVAFWLGGSVRRDDWQRVIHSQVLSHLRPQTSASNRKLYWLLAAIMALALASPAVQTTDDRTFKHAQGWLILVDISRSMTLKDIRPNRLSAARDAALAIASQAGARSTTLIAYAGDAFIISPPSFDREHFNSSVNLLEYKIIPTDGSNLSRALSLATTVIDSSGFVNARLFIVGDGGGINASSRTAVTQLADSNHRTDLILIGSDNPDNETAVDFNTASQFAADGGGTMLMADVLGRIKPSELSLQQTAAGRGLLINAGISALSWSNQSHWILLFALPLWWLVIWRERF